MGYPPDRSFLGALLGAFSLVLFIRPPLVGRRARWEAREVMQQDGGRDEDEEGEREDGGA